MFSFDTPHYLTRADGKRVAMSIPVDLPGLVVAEGVQCLFERQGYRHDGTPAGYYTADDGMELWLCDGLGHLGVK